MKNIQTKRIGIVAICLTLSVLTGYINNKNKADIIATFAVPATNKIIVVDAGHGRRRPEEQ